LRPTGQVTVFLFQQKLDEYDVIKGTYSDIIKTYHLSILFSAMQAVPPSKRKYITSTWRKYGIPLTIPYFRIVPAEAENKV
jgi:hypothetical protein